MSDKNHSTPARKDHRNGPDSLSEKFNLMDLLDPRSPTTAFQRTPIQVILQHSKSVSTEKRPDEITQNIASESPDSFFSLSTPRAYEDESLELSASSASFASLENLTDIESVNLSSDDLSIVVSDLSPSPTEEFEEEFPRFTEESRESDFVSLKTAIEAVTPSPVNDEVDRSIEERSIGPEFIEKANLMIASGNVAVTPSKSSDEKFSTIDTNQDSSNDSLLENTLLIKKKPLKNMFFTPNPNRKRNPLGTVDNTCPTTPPSHLYRSPQPNVLRENQWKRIQEERRKLGLEADENAQLPLYDITASAPGKLIRKSRLRHRLNNVMS